MTLSSSAFAKCISWGTARAAAMELESLLTHRRLRVRLLLSAQEFPRTFYINAPLMVATYLVVACTGTYAGALICGVAAVPSNSPDANRVSTRDVTSDGSVCERERGAKKPDSANELRVFLDGNAIIRVRVALSVCASSLSAPQGYYYYGDCAPSNFLDGVTSPAGRTVGKRRRLEV
jgi:hypothetical protein